MTETESKWAERDRKREEAEKRYEEARKIERERNILDRLRECGLRRRSDGNLSIIVPSDDTIKDAIQEIERLQGELGKFHECNKDTGPDFHPRSNCRKPHYHKEPK